MSKLDDMLKALASKNESQVDTADSIYNEVSNDNEEENHESTTETTTDAGSTQSEPDDPNAAELLDVAGEKGNQREEPESTAADDGDEGESSDEDTGGETESNGQGDEDTTSDTGDDEDDDLDFGEPEDYLDEDGGEDSSDDDSGGQGASDAESDDTRDDEGSEDSQEESGKESDSEEDNSEENSGEENRHQEDSGEEDGSQEDGSEESGEESSSEESGDEVETAEAEVDEEFNDDGQIETLEEVKEKATETDSTLNKTAVIIEEAGEISDRLKSLAHEIMDREGGFSEDASTEALIDMYQFTFENLKEEATQLLGEKEDTKPTRDPYGRAIDLAFTNVTDILTNAIEKSENVLKYALGDGFLTLRDKVIASNVEGKVVLDKTLASTLDVDGELKLSHLQRNHDYSKMVKEIKAWLTLTIGAYLKEIAKGHRALVTPLTLSSVSTDTDYTGKLPAGLEVASKEMSGIYPGNRVLAYVGSNGANAVLQFITLDRQVAIPNEVTTSELTTEALKRLMSDMQALTRVLVDSKETLTLLLSVVTKLSRWHAGATSEDASAVEALRLEHFLPAIVIPSVSVFYQALIQFTAIKSLIEKALEVSTETEA